MSLWKTTVEWGGETYFWASLDGEDWYEVNQDFGADREPEIRELFASNEQAQWKPMCFKRRYLEHMKHDPKIQDVRIENLTGELYINARGELCEPVNGKRGR